MPGLAGGRYRAPVTYRTQSPDTTREAEERQFAIWRAMTIQQRFAVLLELQATATAMAEAAIRRRHPHASDREVFLRRISRSLGPEAMRRWYGWDPDAADL